MRALLTRAVLIFLGIFFIFHSLSAQEKHSSPYAHRPILALKYVPTAIFDRTPAIQFAVEKGTFSHQSIQLEYGWVSDIYNNTQNGFNGHKLKSEYRFYFKAREKKANNVFLGVQYMWKTVIAEGNATVWRYNQSYQEIIPVKLKNETNTAYVVCGNVYPFVGPMYFEVMAGLGARWLNVTVENIPEDAEFTPSLNVGFFNPVRGIGSYVFLGINLSFKIIYSFGKA